VSSNLVGPEKDSCPLPITVFWSVAFFILFLCFGLVAAHHASATIHYISLCACLLLTVTISIMLGRDFFSNFLSDCMSNIR
jgi:hypothetical protein